MGPWLHAYCGISRFVFVSCRGQLLRPGSYHHTLQSLKEVAATNLRIFSAQSCSGPLHEVLKRAPGYMCRWGTQFGKIAAAYACCVLRLCL